MRRFVLIAVFAAAAMAAGRAVAAQERAFGVKAGMILGKVTVTGTERFDTSAEAGAAVGAFAGIEIARGVRLQPEVFLAQHRFRSDSFPLPLTADTRVIEVPVLVVKAFGLERRIRPQLFVGPQINFLTKTTQTVGATKSDLTNELRTVDVGVTAGGGVEIASGRGAMVIDARANIGFRDLTIASTSSMHSRAFIALVGYRF